MSVASMYSVFSDKIIKKDRLFCEDPVVRSWDAAVLFVGVRM